MLGWACGLIYKLIRQVSNQPRHKQKVNYMMGTLPDNVLAVVRLSWYKDGKAKEIDEFVLWEDGQNGYDALLHIVDNAISTGVDVCIRSDYEPEDLGLIR